MKVLSRAITLFMLTALLTVAVTGASTDKTEKSSVVRDGKNVEKSIPAGEEQDIAEEVKTIDEGDEKINDAEKYSGYHYKKPEPKHHDYDYYPKKPEPKHYDYDYYPKKPEPKHHDYNYYPKKPEPKYHDYDYYHKKPEPKYKPKPYHCSKICYTSSYYAKKKCHYPYHVVSCQKRYKKCYKKKSYHYGGYKKHCKWAYKSGYGCSCHYH